jgi:hypothetical protein
MRPSIRSLVRRRRDPRTAPERAPSALRARVMANVRGEPSRRGGPLLVAGAAITALVVAGGLFVFGGTATRHSPSARRAPPAGPSAYLRDSGSRSELLVSGLREPPVGEVYEVWLDRGAHLHPTDALFTVTQTGNATVEVPGDLHGVDAVTVTAEPLGGSTSPTSAPVLRVRVGR